MNWQGALSLNILSFTIAIFFIKIIVTKLPRAQAFFLHFLLCALFVSVYWAVFDKSPLVLSAFLQVGAAGFLNAFGANFQWKAIKINLSKTVLFQPLSDVLAVILAGIILKEIARWNLPFFTGIILCFVAIWLFLLGSQSKTVNKENIKNLKQWLLYTVGMIVIFGINVFLMKLFSFKIPQVQFLMFWYLGFSLGAAILLFLEREGSFILPGKLIFLVPLSSLIFLTQQATLYLSFQLALASRILPIRLVATTLLPVIVGWVIFKEWKGLSMKEILAFLIGAAGIFLVGLSY